MELVIAQNNVKYADFVLSGYYEYAYPNPYQPETVTTLGQSFDVDPEIAYKFSQFAYGDQFHLILGEQGEVSDVIAYSPDYATPLIGILGSNSVVTLLNGIEITGDSTNRLYAEQGQLVKVTPRGNGEINIAPANSSQGYVLDLDTMKLGKYKL